MFKKICLVLLAVTGLAAVPIYAVRIINDSEHSIAISNITYSDDYSEDGQPCLMRTLIGPYECFDHDHISSFVLTINQHDFSYEYTDLRTDMMIVYGRRTIHNCLQGCDFMPIWILRNHIFMHENEVFEIVAYRFFSINNKDFSYDF